MLAIPLAWLQLTYQKGRLAIAIAGINNLFVFLVSSAFFMVLVGMLFTEGVFVFSDVVNESQSIAFCLSLLHPTVRLQQLVFFLIKILSVAPQG